MAEERLSYTVAADDGETNARQVDLILTYDPNAMNQDGSFTVTGASGTYETLDSSGNVVNTDQVTGLGPSTGFGSPDNKLFVGTTPYVTSNGITFTINNVDDSDDGSGSVNFYSPDGTSYLEDNHQAPASNVSEAAVTCFVSGTLIRTAAGDVAVENLQVGDIAVTSSGAQYPIRWLGHRKIDCRRHRRPHEAKPVRIAAHAFGENLPARDLFVSPGHSLCVDVLGEVLIPASALVNGTTIAQIDVENVTYWHVELEDHQIILAENLPVESYLEMGNRAFFAQADLVAFDASPDVPARTHDDFCRPFHCEGDLVSALRLQLSRRASMLGWRLEPRGMDGLRLEVDGNRLDACVRGLVARFAIPKDVREIWLVSGTNTPAAISDSSDRRNLGACVQALAVDDGFGGHQSIAIDDPLLSVGFHDVEREGDRCWRWTSGRARLPVALLNGAEDEFFLRVELGAPMLPHWVLMTGSSSQTHATVERLHAGAIRSRVRP